MSASTHSSTQTLYEQDYQLWLKATIAQLCQGKFSDLDLDNLIEELESMGRSDRRALKSLLTRLLEHLLKLAYWASEREYNANKWKAEITTFRLQIKEILEESPSLKPYLVEIFEKCNSDARKIVSRLIGCEVNTLPSSAHATVEQALDENWFPGEIEP